MRKVLFSFVVVGTVSVVGVGSADAAPGMLPDAACNRGTMNAHEKAPYPQSQGHMHIPKMMDMDGAGPNPAMCMSMP